MAVDVDLVRAYTNGLVAVTGYQVTDGTLPTDASTGIDAGFSEVGSISSEGITEQTAQDTTDVYQWQNNALVRTIKGQFTKTFVFEAQETNLITLGVQYPGSTITQTAEGVTVAEKPPGPDTRNWVLHGIDGNRALRLVIPRGEVVERGDVVWSADGVTIYGWTLRCYVDTSEVVAYRYYLDASLASGS